MTAAQIRREAAHEAFNDELATCPGHETLAILGTKWLTLVVDELEAGPLGHAQLARRVAGATQKMLTQTLRQLERDGLVTRTVTPSVPPQVQYELTPLGRSLLPLQRAIRAWGEAHMPDVRAARAHAAASPAP